MSNSDFRKIYFKDLTARSNGNPSWSQWQKPGIGRVDYHAAPQYAAWKALGDELNKTGRPIYYSICPHTMASQRGTAKNYSGRFPQTPPICACPPLFAFGSVWRTHPFVFGSGAARLLAPSDCWW